MRGARAMEERVERREIKGKNSSEITELFIFPALSLWAFEEVTLVYLCVLGPSAAGGPPVPPPKAHCFYQQQLPPSMLPLEPFEVGPAGVYSPACKKRVQGAGSAAGGRRDGGPLIRHQLVYLGTTASLSPLITQRPPPTDEAPPFRGVW